MSISSMDAFSCNIRPLPPLLAKKAKEELNENSDRNEEDIKILRDWIKKQPHLKARTDDQFLMSFIRSSKHSLERAKKKIDLFYTVRTAVPELYKNRNPDDPKIIEMLKFGSFVYLPETLGEDGPRICIIRPGLSDPSKHSAFDAIRGASYVGDLGLINDDNLIVAGTIEIVDLAHITMAHLFQFDVMFIKKMSVLGGDASPLRHKGTHVINTPPAFESVFNLFKGFLSEKQRRLLFVHGTNMESLHKYIPQRLLPKEYGGENGSIADLINYWEKKVLDYRDYFIEEDKYGTVEKLRPGQRHSPNMFGLDGTFRKLNVD